MITKFCIVLSFLTLAACQTAPQQTTVIVPPPPHANINQLLTVSQFRTPLFYLEAPLYDPEVKEWIPQKFLDDVQKSIDDTINYPYTDTQLRLALSQKLSSIDTQQVIDFYQSTTGQNILQAEQSFRERVNLSSDSTALAADVIKATLLSTMLHNVFMSSVDAVISRLDSYECLAIRQIPGSNIGLLMAKRHKVAFMERQVQRSLSNLYLNVSDADLQAYLQFAQSAVGQKYFKARNEAMLSIGKEFGERVAEAIAPALPNCMGSFKVSS